MKTLHLLLALPSRPDQWLQFATRSAPSLIKLLQRGRAALPEPSLAGTLCQACGVKQQQDWPLAPISALADDLAGANDADAYWLRIDPVHLEVVMGGLLLRPTAGLQLAMSETRALITDINQHWQTDGLQIQAVNPNRWYLRLAQTPNLRTTPLDQMVGEYLTPNLPRGADARRLLQQINEVQMLLHSHPVNLSRENDGRPLLNGLWLWGGGTLPARNTLFDLIVGDDFETQALAHHSGANFVKQPTSMAALPKCSHVLAVLTQPDANLESDVSVRLEQLERDWFKPLLRQLNRGRLSRVRLDLIGRQAVTLTPSLSWRIWR